METWCLVIDWIGNEFADAVTRIVQDHCRRHGRAFLLFTVGSLSYHLDEAALGTHLVPVLRLPRIDRFLYSAGQIVRGGGADKLSSLVRPLAPKPAVTLGARIQGLPYCEVQHDQAFLSLLDHLWDHHGYRRFAWVGGPPDNPVASHRRALFLGFLEERNHSLAPTLDVPGDFNLSAGREAGERLADRTGEIDVVVAANDSMAVGIREVLGPGVPVTGFDNHPSARMAGITTVDTELAEEVRAALDYLSQGVLDTALGDPEPRMLGKLVVRTSCGCPAGPEEPPPPAVPGSSSTERVGPLFEAILEAADLAELAGRLKHALPSEEISYWKILPSPDRGDRSTSLDLWPQGAAAVPEMVVHSLFRDDEVYGYLVHDLSQQNYTLSEWLRINLSLTFHAWHRRSGNLQVQKLLQVELDRFTRRQRDVEGVLNSLPVWIVELDRRLQLRYGNQAWKDLTGWTGPRVHGPLSRTVAPLDAERLENRLFSTLKTGKASSVDFHFVTPGGKRSSVLGEIHPLSEEDGSPLATLFGSLHGGGGLRLVGLDLQPLVEGILQPEDLMFQHFDFSPREQEAIRWLAQGLDSEQVAEAMDIAPSTVRVILHHVYTKAGVTKKRELLDLLADYNARAPQPQSLTQVLLSRIVSPS